MADPDDSLASLLPQILRSRTFKPSNLVHRGFYDLLATFAPTTSSFLGGGEIETLGGPSFDAVTPIPPLIDRRNAPLPSLPSTPKQNPSPSKLQKRSKNIPSDRMTTYRNPLGTAQCRERSFIEGWSDVVGVGLGLGFGNVSTFWRGGWGQDGERPIERVKVDKAQISWPLDFRHVAHAATTEEAQYLLMRWATDGMGKVANPIWAKAMKENVRRRAEDQQARAIAQVMIAREQGLIREEPYHTLRVVNGLPSSVYSSRTPTTPSAESKGALSLVNRNAANSSNGLNGWEDPVTRGSPKKHFNPFEQAFRPMVEDPIPPIPYMGAGPSTLATVPQTRRFHVIKRVPPPKEVEVVMLEDEHSSPSQAKLSSTRGQWQEGSGVAEAASESIRAILASKLSKVPEDAQDGHDHSATVEAPSITESMIRATIRSVVPSLPTLEKATSTAVYFETLYWAILKPPKSLESAHHQNYMLTRERRRLALEEEMKRQRLGAAAKEKARARWREEETWDLRQRRQKVDAKSFKKLKTIGHGAFGVVSLVQEFGTGQLYAMKELRKTDMLRKGQEAHVRAERDLLAASQSPWIVKLFYSFQDMDHLYLVLAYEGGGDLLNLLVQLDTFDEEFTKFYAAEMILALEATHKLGFIHRDIKPDNFLFSSEGHLRVADFGLATDLHWAHDTTYYEHQRRALLKKHGIDLEDQSFVRRKTMRRQDIDALVAQRWKEEGDGYLTWKDKRRRKMAFSVCGTNSYMSPEVIRGMGYGFSCDWWSLGIIVFECLFGYPPFIAKTRHITRQKILNWKSALRFPTTPPTSPLANDFIASLLCEPEDRLGSSGIYGSNQMSSRTGASGLGRDGAEDIKNHPWFNGVDWANLQYMTPPYQPNLSNAADTKHFDDDIPNEASRMEMPLLAQGGPLFVEAKDPMLRSKIHGPQLLELRKGGDLMDRIRMAFAGWTYKASGFGLAAHTNTSHAVYEAHAGLSQEEEAGRKPCLVRGRASSL